MKYPNDLVLLAKKEMVLQGMTDRLTEIGKCCGMEINKVMRISRKPPPYWHQDCRQHSFSVHSYTLLVVSTSLQNGKTDPMHNKKAYMKHKSIVSSILNAGTIYDMGGQLYCLSHSIPWEKPSIPTEQKAGWPPEPAQTSRREKPLAHTAIAQSLHEQLLYSYLVHNVIE